MANYYRFIPISTNTLSDTVVWESHNLDTVFTPEIRFDTNPLSFWNDPGEDIYNFEDGEPI